MARHNTQLLDPKYCDLPLDLGALDIIVIYLIFDNFNISEKRLLIFFCILKLQIHCFEYSLKNLRWKYLSRGDNLIYKPAIVLPLRPGADHDQPAHSCSRIMVCTVIYPASMFSIKYDKWYCQNFEKWKSLL